MHSQGIRIPLIPAPVSSCALSHPSSPLPARRQHDSANYPGLLLILLINYRKTWPTYAAVRGEFILPEKKAGGLSGAVFSPPPGMFSEPADWPGYAALRHPSTSKRRLPSLMTESPIFAALILHLQITAWFSRSACSCFLTREVTTADCLS